MIRHTVIFTLKHSKETPEGQAFFVAAERLAEIRGVQNFEVLKQTSIKNDFEYGISMEFAGNEEYELYNNDPAHAGFIEQHWLKEVERFMEIDYEPLTTP